jgi:hypothetical protein
MFALLFTACLAFASPDTAETEPAEPAPTEETVTESAEEESAAPAEAVANSPATGGATGPSLSQAFAAPPPKIRGKKLTIAGLVTSGVSLTASLMGGLCSPTAHYGSCEQPLAVTALVGVPTGIVMASAGGIQWAITSKKARNFDPQAANTTSVKSTSGKRATSLEAKWAHLEGQKQIRKGTALIVAGSFGMVGGAASVGAGFGAMAASGHYLGAIFALAGIGGAILIVPPSLAMIIVGSVLVHKGRNSLNTALEYSPSKFHASVVPMTTRNGAGLALQGRF